MGSAFMRLGDKQGMWDTISAYIFCLILGLLGLVVAGWLIVSGQVVHSVDDLFLVLVCLLLVVVCFSYLGWRVQAALSESKKKKANK